MIYVYRTLDFETLTQKYYFYLKGGFVLLGTDKCIVFRSVKNADCGLQTADCGPGVKCRLQTAD